MKIPAFADLHCSNERYGKVIQKEKRVTNLYYNFFNTISAAGEQNRVYNKSCQININARQKNQKDIHMTLLNTSVIIKTLTT